MRNDIGGLLHKDMRNTPDGLVVPWSLREFPHLVVSTRHRVVTRDAERVVGAVGRLLACRGITGATRIRLTGPSCDHGPTLVQVNLRVGSTPARMQATVSAGDAQPALNRLDYQIATLSAPWRPRPWPDWTRRALAAPASAEITRRKSFALRSNTPMQAVAMMDAMDYDVHLFTDTETGEDAVVYRAGPLGLRLARQHRMRPPGPSSAGATERDVLTVNPRHTPTLTEAAAVDRLHKYGLPFLFFTDEAAGRGRLLYPRYDGDLGLISPSDDIGKGEIS